jgi:predicted AlkP superfamily pyrophosphatase or phosphodiesterase
VFPAPLEEITDRLREYHVNNPRFKYKDYIAAFMSDHGISIGFAESTSLEFRLSKQMTRTAGQN